MEPNPTHPILYPKVHIPPSRLQIVSRQRLLGILDSGLHRKMTLISAPAGYGKSTLLSEWAAGCEWPLGWVTLEAGDNDIDRFLIYLISAVEAAGVSSPSPEGLLGARFSLQPLPLDAMLAILVNQIPSAVERLVLVLEDYHTIDNPDIHHFLTALLDHQPPNIHIIITTRVDPPLRLAHLRAKDQLNEITERELRFTTEEASAFFSEVMGVRLTGEQIATLGARTEGWVTGLQLAGLSLKELEHPAKLIETLTGTHRYILDYLMQEVFSDLPPMMQTFLTRVSILERLSPELCDAVVGSLEEPGGSEMPRRSKEILAFMDASNLFIMPLDHQRQWYRFHPLFADFLHDRLATHYADDLPKLHHRAASWYFENGMPVRAVEHSFAVSDFERAADLIQALSKDMLTRGEISTLNRWTSQLPEKTFEDRPRLGLARAWAMLVRDPLSFRETIEGQIKQIAAGFGIEPQDLLRALTESEPGSERRASLGEFAMLLAFIQRDVIDTHETIELFKAAYDHLPESEGMLRSFTLAGLASTYARAEAMKQAEETFEQAAQSSLAAGSIYGYVTSTGWQATMQVEQGQLRRAEETYCQAIEMLSSQGTRPLPFSGHVYVGLASILLEWNDLAAALENVQTGLRIGKKVNDLDALLKGYVVLAIITQALDRGDEAKEALREGERVAMETKSIDCLREAQAWNAHLALTSGELQEAQLWAAERRLEEGGFNQVADTLHEVEQLTFARLLMAVGKASVALPILEVIAGHQEQTGRTGALIESLALQALCLRSLGRMDEAVRTLRRALLLAEPEGFVRTFVQEGPSMAALLRTARAQGHSPDYIQKLLESFGETADLQEPLLDPLSERELEVLQLVAEGMSNTEIASELVIAHSTVKTHINRIYNKLGVSTRTQAVARARQLQLIA